MNSLKSPAEEAQAAAAASELLRRRQARSGLLHFTNFTFPQYRAEAAHELIARTVDRVISGEIKRLMIFAPPQHGKSELVSVRLPAFWLGRRPDDPVLLSSYAADLAYSKSRQARDIIESDAFRMLFPMVATSRDSRAVNQWQIAGRRGYMKAVGVGGPVTGHGGPLGIIDDPFENWEQAQSLTHRNRVWDWYRGTFRTRIWENGAIVLIMTRWHEDDLAGRLLEQDAGGWEVLRLPALAESQADRDAHNIKMHLGAGLPDPLNRDPGAALCPKRFSAGALHELKADVGSLVWSAEYQGAPTLPEGGMFKRHWLPIVDAAPAEGRAVRYWDKAGSAGGGDYSAGVKLVRSTDNLFYITDVIRGQWSSGQRNAVIEQTAQLDGERVTIWVEQEPGSGGKESAENSIRLLAGFNVHREPVTGEKWVRAMPLAAQCEAGNVKLVRGAWNGDFIEELTGFPTGTHDDQVDAASGAFNKLAKKKGFAPL
jgi:predicted phage terminase large subunit-like protein